MITEEQWLARKQFVYALENEDESRRIRGEVFRCGDMCAVGLAATTMGVDPKQDYVSQEVYDKVMLGLGINQGALDRIIYMNDQVSDDVAAKAYHPRNLPTLPFKHTWKEIAEYAKDKWDL